MKLPWARILLAAFVVELLFAAYVFLVLGSSDAAFSPPGRMGAFGFMLAGGLWVGSRAQWNAIPQGILVGVAAHLFYLLIVLIVWVVVATDIPLPPLVPGLNPALKVLGGGVGGWAGRRWSDRRTSQATADRMNSAPDA